MHRSHPPMLFLILASLAVAGCRNAGSDGQISVQPQGAGKGLDLPSPLSRLAFSGKPASSRHAPDESKEDSAGSAGKKEGVEKATTEPRGSSFSLSDRDGEKNAPPPATDPLDPSQFTPEELAILDEALAGASPEIRALAMRRMADRRKPATEPAAAPAPETGIETAAASTTVDSARDVQQASGQSAPPRGDQPPQSAEGAAAPQNSGIQQTSSVAPASPTAAAEFPMPDLTTSGSSTPAATTPALPQTPPLGAPPSTAASSTAASSTAAPANSTPQSPTPPALETPALETPALETPSKGTSSPSASAVPSGETPATTTDPSTASTGSSGVDLSGASDQALLDELAARAVQRTSGTAEPPLAEVARLRMLHVLRGKPDDAVMKLEGWTSAEQEFFNHQMLGLWQLVDDAGNPVRRRRWSAALPSLRQATQSLAAATGTLEVRGLQFCQEVLGYGQTVSFSSRQYTPGQQIILYSEVENFDAERLSDGYETHLRGSYQILDETGKLVAEQILEDDRQSCTNYRRDYYLAYILHLPKQLRTGHYRFELTLEDVKGKTFGQASIPLEIKNP